MNDLKLSADSVPLLVGEMLDKDQGGVCWGMNEIIATIPQKIDNSHVISSTRITIRVIITVPMHGRKDLWMHMAVVLIHDL